MSIARKTVEDRVATQLRTSLARIESDLAGLVQAFIKPLFEVFEFFELPGGVLTGIVDKFIAEVKKSG